MSLEERICPECEEGELEEEISHNPMNFVTGACLWGMGGLGGSSIAQNLKGESEPVYSLVYGLGSALIGGVLFYLFDMPFGYEKEYECGECSYKTNYLPRKKIVDDYDIKDPVY